MQNRKTTKIVKELPISGEFRKNFSFFMPYQRLGRMLVFGSDEKIGIHRGTHEYRRCKPLATEPGDSPRASDFHSCL
ncbi:hypothetical protein [Fibrobacter sp. UWR3]|uniref:hypothetical protein n=1 Tax=Fibrobacter sp. UWR3 TaxID=1896217 RepID=UPI001160A7C4|nr:hypothetical protein [Fibrobacter sp. UWR3]